MRLKINLASFDYKKARRMRAGLWAAAFLLAGVAALQAALYVSYEEEQRFLESGQAKVRQTLERLEKDLRSHGLDPSPTGLEDFKQRVALLNGFIAQRAFSWTLLLNELEATVPKDISVKTVKPKFPEGSISLQGQGLELTDLTRFMVRLEESAVFQDVFLKKQNTNSEGLVEFILEFKYRPEGQLVRS